MLEETTFIPISKNLIKQLEKTNLSIKCILFYSYACRLQAIKNEKSKESEDNCLSVPELSEDLNIDRKTAKKFCEELVALGLMYHNTESSVYENIYQALFLPATAYYENNTWHNDFEEFYGIGDIKYLINLYTRKVKNEKKCQSGFIKIPDKIFFTKDLTWTEKTWWVIFYIIDSCYKTYTYNSIKKTFNLSKNKKNKEIYAHIEKLMNKGFIYSYKATKDGFKITIGTEKSKNQPIVERRQYEEREVKNYNIDEEILEIMKNVESAEEQLYELLDKLSAGEAVDVEKLSTKKSIDNVEEIEELSYLLNAFEKTEKVEIKKSVKEEANNEEIPEDFDEFLKVVGL